MPVRTGGAGLDGVAGRAPGAPGAAAAGRCIPERRAFRLGAANRDPGAPGRRTGSSGDLDADGWRGPGSYRAQRHAGPHARRRSHRTRRAGRRCRGRSRNRGAAGAGCTGAAGGWLRNLCRRRGRSSRTHRRTAGRAGAAGAAADGGGAVESRDGGATGCGQLAAQQTTAGVDGRGGTAAAGGTRAPAGVAEPQAQQHGPRRLVSCFVRRISRSAAASASATP